MVEVLQVIFYIICIGVMLLVGNSIWHSRKMTNRQLELIELEIKKFKSNFKE